MRHKKTTPRCIARGGLETARLLSVFHHSVTSGFGSAIVHHAIHSAIVRSNWFFSFVASSESHSTSQYEAQRKEFLRHINIKSDKTYHHGSRALFFCKSFFSPLASLSYSLLF